MHDASLLPLAAASTSPGLVWAYRMLPGEPVQELASGDVEAALAAPEGWIWLHVDLIDKRTHGWIGESCGLPPAVRASLEAHAEALALRHEDGVVHGLCADFHRELDQMTNTIGRLAFAVSERLLVTGRRHTLNGPDELRRALQAGARPQTAYDLFAALVNTFCDHAGQRLAETAAVLDDIEDRLVSGHAGDERRRLTGVRRLALAMHRPVAALCGHFHAQERSNWALSQEGHAMLQRLGDRLAALDREVVTANERAKLLQEELSAELESESNRSLKALAVMTALLLPGSFISGIFGMNTAGLPFVDTPGGFWIALGLAVLATTLFYLALRRAGVSLRF